MTKNSFEYLYDELIDRVFRKFESDLKCCKIPKDSPEVSDYFKRHPELSADDLYINICLSSILKRIREYLSESNPKDFIKQALHEQEEKHKQEMKELIESVPSTREGDDRLGFYLEDWKQEQLAKLKSEDA